MGGFLGDFLTGKLADQAMKRAMPDAKGRYILKERFGVECREIGGGMGKGGV